MRIKPNQAVERTASQPTGRVAGGGVRGGWLAFAPITYCYSQWTSLEGDCPAACVVKGDE